MSNSYGTFSFIYMLTSSSACSEYINSYIFWVYFNVYIIIKRATLQKLAEKALKELEEAYKRIPDTDNGKAYLFRGKERVRMMLEILKEG
jgi:hypothetical protein